MGKSYWLFKTEPGTFSFQQLLKDGTTNWNGVRNFQARNYLKTAKQGDLALIYHSGDERQVVGVAQIVRDAYPDLDDKKPGDWVQIDIAPLYTVKNPVTLKEIKSTPALQNLPLLKQSRLSVMPVTEEHFQILMKMGGVTK